MKEQTCDVSGSHNQVQAPTAVHIEMNIRITETKNVV